MSYDEDDGDFKMNDFDEDEFIDDGDDALGPIDLDDESDDPEDAYH